MTPAAASQTETGGYGSLEKGISGNYQLTIGDILKEGWEKTKGAKLTFWLALLAYMAAYFVAAFLLVFAFRMMGAVEHPKTATEILLAVVQQVFLIAVTLPMSVGLYMLAVKRAVDQPIRVADVFEYFGNAFQLLATAVLMYIMLMIGFVLLIIPGIYLLIAYSLAMPLVVDKNLGPWNALETSRKAVSRRWFSVLGLWIVILLIMFVSMIPLGIGLIWTMPFAMIAYGILYRNIFGYDGTKTV